MKKFVALALFAVMVLMMIPAANAAYGQPAKFIAKNAFEAIEDGEDLIFKQYDKEKDTLDVIAADKSGSTYSKEIDPAALQKSYASKYDANGKAYYYVVIPVPTNLVSHIYDFKSIKLNGEELKIGNFIEGLHIADGIGYYVVGYADIAKGFAKTYTWEADDGNGNTAKTTYTVKLTLKAAPAADVGMNYNISGKGEGYAISTKKGIVYVDLAPDYIAEVANGLENAKLDATLTLTVDGKNPIPDGEFGYLTVEGYFDGVEIADYVSTKAYKNTDTMKLQTPALSDVLAYYAAKMGEVYETTSNLYIDDVRMNITLDTSAAGDCVAKNIKVVYRVVEVGDPKGIYFVDGNSKTVEVGDTFTLDVAGKEATLMEKVQYFVDGDILTVSDGKFFAVKKGVAYVSVEFKYAHSYYNDTIKVVVTEEPATTSYYVVCRALNVRKGPSTSYGKVGLVYRNDIVDVISVDNGWAKIWFEGAERYVSYKYIDQK